MNYLCRIAVFVLGLSLALGCHSEITSTSSLALESARPNTPTNLKAEGLSTSSIGLTWEDNSNDEEDFRVHRRPSGTSQWTKIATLSANTTAYTDRGLASGQGFEYRVIAVNPSARSRYSNIASAQTHIESSVTLARPNTPTNLKAEGLSTSSIGLTWEDNSDDEEDFRVHRRPSGTSQWTKIATLSANTTAYTDRGLASGQGFEYRVIAVNPSARSRYSNIASAKTQSGVSCVYTIAPGREDVSAASNTGQITVTAPDGCSWTATESLDWITISAGATGNGSGTLTYSVSENQNTSARSGIIKIADQSFTLSQEAAQAPCTYTMSPTTASFASEGGLGTIQLTTSDSTCAWETNSSNAWVTIASGGQSGQGNATIGYSVETHTGTIDRSGAISVAGQTFLITQAKSSNPPPPSTTPSDPPLPSTSPRADAIPLDILEPAERNTIVDNHPVSVGLVFPEGALTSTRGRVVNDLGQTIAHEAEVTGMWQPDRTSIKWLLLHFRVSTDRKYFFEPGSEPYTPQGNLLATTEGDSIKISTGPLEVTMTSGANRLFKQATLRGQPMLQDLSPSHVLERDHGGIATLSDWEVSIEENTPARAVIRATGRFTETDQTPVAQLDVRAYFYRDESFVRLLHTMTWMIQAPEEGLNEIYLGLTPKLDQANQFKLGLSDYGSQSTDFNVSLGDDVEAFQSGPTAFRVFKNNQQVSTGTKLGGWISLEEPSGHGLGISLKHAWQTFPTTLAMEDGQLRVKFWPDRSVPMRFTYNDIMPDDFYYLEEYWQAKFDSPHFVHEMGHKDSFLHTAEGAARTHALTVFFYDEASSRTPAELNSLNQHPLVVRQDPSSALRVPIMGFSFAPADPETNPSLEAALETIGIMTTIRFADLHDYGFWRFGFPRWAEPGDSLKRWFDGVQYDNQMTPWLLYMRGGGRQWYEEGEIMARFAMDVATNHYNTRDVPTGYQSAAAGMPFPWKAKNEGKHMRIHFLAYHYHLTGDKRAKDVLDEVIEGAKTYALSKPSGKRSRNRGTYNMNRFWVNAYEETGEEEIKDLAREWLALTLGREWEVVADSNLFNSSDIYLYNGLIAQFHLWKKHQWGPVQWDSRWDGTPSQTSWTLEDMENIMLANLTQLAFPGITSQWEKSIARTWAYEQTGNLEYLKKGWATAEAIAGAVPKGSVDRNNVLRGNMLFRIYLMPILSNTALPDPR